MSIKINFEFETEYGKYADALIFEDNQPLPSDAEIDSMKAKRLNNWIDIITAPSIEIEDEVI